MKRNFRLSEDFARLMDDGFSISGKSTFTSNITALAINEKSIGLYLSIMAIREDKVCSNFKDEVVSERK